MKQKLFQVISDQLNENREAPENYEKYITDLRTTTNIYSSRFHTEEDVFHFQKDNGFGVPFFVFTKAVLDKKQINKIEIFKEQKMNDKNNVVEVIGSMVYDADGYAYFEIFKASTTGRVLNQTDIITVQVCKKKSGLFHHTHCWDENREVARENTEEEIEGMKKVLLSKSLLGIKTKFYEENEILHKESQNNQQPGGSSDITKDPNQEAIQEKKNTFITNLKKLVDNSRTKPDGYENLVRNIKSFTDVNMDMFNKNEVEVIAKKYSLPEEVTKKLKTIAFLSEPMITDSIKYLNDNKNATIEELLGVIIKEKDNIFFAFIRSKTEGEIPYRTKNVSVKKCHRVLFGHSCHYENEIVEDPYTASELQSVKQALMALSSESLDNKLNTISESQILLGSGRIVSPDGNIAAILNNDGKVYVGPATNPLIGTLYTIGTAQSETFAPYSLQVKENGNLYIINKNNDKVWTSNTANKGQGPFKLSLDNNGILILTDKDNKVIFQGK